MPPKPPSACDRTGPLQCRPKCRTARASQTPNVIDLPFVLDQREHVDKHGTGDATDDKCITGCIRSNQHTGRRPAGGRCAPKPRSFLPVAAPPACRPHHGHQRIHRHQTGNLVQSLGAHHVEAEPADTRIRRPAPGTECLRAGAPRANHPCGNGCSGPSNTHCEQRNPSAHRMNHHRAREIVELVAGQMLDPGLDAEMLVPGNSFKEWVNKPNDHGSCQQLWPEAGAFRNAAGDDGRDGCGKRQQEEELPVRSRS